MDLSGIATADLVAEMERRVKCAAKPEKRMIFIGLCPEDPSPSYLR
jgi:hypothetical protein